MTSQKIQMIFNETELLKIKLAQFLQTPTKLAIYAKAAKKFYKNDELKFAFSWSWWGFFAGGWFFLYRKLYLQGILLLFISFLLCISSLFEGLEYYTFFASFAFCVFCAVFAKYAVIRRFCRLLGSSASLEEKGGVAEWAIYLGIFITFLMYVCWLAAAIFLGVWRFIEENLDFNKFYIEPQPGIEVFLNLVRMC